MEIEKNSRVIPGVNEPENQSSTIDHNVAQPEQKSNDRGETSGAVNAQKQNGPTQPARWPGFYPPKSTNDLPVVIVGQNTRIPELTQWSGQVLLAGHHQKNLHLGVYHRGDGFARVLQFTNEPKVQMLDRDGLYGILARAARWTRVHLQEKQQPDGTMSTVSTLETIDAPHKHLGDAMTWPDMPLPRLKGLSKCPMVLPDGRIVGAQPGYDPQSGYWFTGTELPTLPDVVQARNILADWLIDFPIDTAGKANIIGILTANMLRPLLEAQGLQAFPGLALDATSPGSGKTLLAIVMGIILTGRAPSLSPFPDQDDEWRKNITSWVLDGKSYQLYDNLDPKKSLDSSKLAALLTTGHWSDRLLGQNQTLNLEVSAQIVFTGNHMHMSTELSRRVVLIRVTPNVDRPWTRTPDAFIHPNIIMHSMSHRGEILGALLSLIQHWFDVGQPRGKEIMGNYEILTQTVGGVLGAGGIAGWLSNADEATNALDEERALWLGILEIWHERFKDTSITAGELFEHFADTDMLTEIPWFTARDDGGKRWQPGRRIKGQLNAVIGPWKITEAGRERSGVPRYCLVSMPADTQSENETNTMQNTHEPSEVY